MIAKIKKRGTYFCAHANVYAYALAITQNPRYRYMKTRWSGTVPSPSIADSILVDRTHHYHQMDKDDLDRIIDSCRRPLEGLCMHTCMRVSFGFWLYLGTCITTWRLRTGAGALLISAVHPFVWTSSTVAQPTGELREPKCRFMVFGARAGSAEGVGERDGMGCTHPEMKPRKNVSVSPFPSCILLPRTGPVNYSFFLLFPYPRSLMRFGDPLLAAINK